MAAEESGDHEWRGRPEEGKGLVWFDRFLGRPDRPSAGGGSRPLALGSLTHASGRDILIL